MREDEQMSDKQFLTIVTTAKIEMVEQIMDEYEKDPEHIWEVLKAIKRELRSQYNELTKPK